MLFRSRKINNRNGFSSPLRARNGCKTITYQDTISSQFVISSTADSFTYTTGQLLPGLNTSVVAAITTRIFVPRCIFVEVVPSGTTTNPGILQLQIPASWGGNRTSESFGGQPFKITSLVNPTLYKLDFRAIGRTCPYVLRPTSAGDVEDLMTIRARTNAAASATFDARITTIVDILPQDGLLNQTPTASLKYIEPTIRALTYFPEHDSNAPPENTEENRCNSEEVKDF